jgi:membrane-associated phospholipid phosphatase
VFIHIQREWTLKRKAIPMSEKPPQEELHEQVESIAEGAKHEVTASRRPWYHLSHAGSILLIIYAIQLSLFGVLIWLVHLYPVNPIDITITREFQENPTAWLKISMEVVSYPGSTFVLPCLVLLAAVIFWLGGLRLEAVFVVALSLLSLGMNMLVKILVARPRPTSHFVNVFQAATGQSFPSGHVMAYLAFWGLLFSFGIILFQGVRWWRMVVLVVSALFVALIGPSRIYLGDHWASDVLGSYLIGGILLGIALWIYLKLKERGVLETEHARTRSKAFRSFNRK